MKTCKYKRVNLVTMLAVVLTFLAPHSFADTTVVSKTTIALKDLPPLPSDANTNPPWIQKRNLESDVAKAFQSEDFATLDRMAEQFRVQDSRLTDGASKLSIFYPAFETMMQNRWGEKDFVAAVEKKFSAWIKASPGITTPSVAYARWLVGYGWAARGTGFASTVSEQQWESFRLNIQKAEDALERVQAIKSSDAGWYWVMLKVAVAQGWPAEPFVGLASEAMQHFPNETVILLNIETRLMPKWGGSLKALDAFIHKATEASREKWGEAMYALLYEDLKGQYMIGERWAEPAELFTTTAAEWPRMKQGFIDLVIRYPVPENYKIFAFMACYAGDKETAQELMEKAFPVTQPNEDLEKCYAALGLPRSRPKALTSAPSVQEVNEQNFRKLPSRAMALDALQNGQFDVLEALYKLTLHHSSESLRDWTRLNDIHRAIEWAFSQLQIDLPAGRENIRVKLKRWQSTSPDSVFAKLAMANFLLRASEYTIDPPAQGMAQLKAVVTNLFSANTAEQARAYIEAIKPMTAMDPEWYVLSIRAFKNDQKVIEKLQQEAFQKYHYTFRLYTAVLDHMTASRRINEVKEVAVFIDEAAKRSQAMAGDYFYSGLWESYDNIRDVGANFFDTLPVDWPRIRNGTERALQIYPTIDEQQDYLRYACLKGDQQKIAELLSALGRNVKTIGWFTPSRLAQCDLDSRNYHEMLRTDDKPFMTSIQLAFTNNKFDLIEAQHADIVKGQLRDASGNLRLENFYQALGDVISEPQRIQQTYQPDYWVALGNKIDDWGKSFPKSAAVRYMQARFLVSKLNAMYADRNGTLEAQINADEIKLMALFSTVVEKNAAPLEFHII